MTGFFLSCAFYAFQLASNAGDIQLVSLDGSHLSLKSMSENNNTKK